ncbi:MAG: polysaccharide biosynthesis tyrosine autokinase [Acidobacteriia bacterium]|nr:polysaccharide biosynthesis tyrosine autokinase [Terriglobia bacterium]
MHSPDSQNGFSRDLVSANGSGRLLVLEPTEQNPANSSDGLISFWQLIRFRMPTLILMILAGGLISIFITLHEIPVYRALTTIEIDSENPLNRLVDADGMEAGASSADYLQTQVRVLQSRSLRQRVIAKLNTQQRKPFQRPDQLTAWARALGLKLPGGSQPKPGTMAPVSIEVRVLEGSRIVEISGNSTDPELASDMINTLAHEYVEQSVESRWNAAQGATGWLGRQLDELREKLEKSEGELHSYSESSGLLFTDEKNTVEEEKLRGFQTEFSAAQADRILKQAALEAAKSNAVETLPEIIDNPRLNEQQTKLADLKRQLAELSSTMTPEHYRVARVQAQINELESSLEKERQNILARVNVDYDAARRRENLLLDRYSAQAKRVADLSDKTIYYNVLKQEVDTTRKLYDTLLEKVKEFGVASALRASNVHVIDPALPPRQPSYPNPWRNLAMGLFSGLFAGIGLVLAGQRLDRSIRGPGEASFHLKLPELGVIPSRALPDRRTRRRRPTDMLPEQTPEMSECVELVTWQNKGSAIAESFRNTLASVLLAHDQAHRPRVIMITSPGWGEGKSTTSSNLAIALAEINYKVLLIDADIRKPSLHTIFNLPNTWGLSDLLRERNPLADSPLEALARRTEIDGLYVMPSGPSTVSISNLLYSARMVDLLDRVRSLFDMIIVDTPPLLYVSDARVLGRLVDGAILVVRAGTTTRDAAMIAKQRFSHDGVSLLGLVLNAWDLKSKGPYSYSYEYGYAGSDQG